MTNDLALKCTLCAYVGLCISKNTVYLEKVMIIDFHAEDTATFTFEHRGYRGDTAGYGPTPVLIILAFVVNSDDC